ncbi:UDP-N-acetylglucosamine 1-carboxyvinyltransferase [Candidatus Gracilibacteria bacterium]|nr:UDP-N-acetylglucosamine 1-carboxyvinyltransferase [Candidatus Gracilibacteria bacterium]
MFYFEIEGGNKLSGNIKIPGAKNASLPMLCAALLTDEKCTFHSVPKIADVETLLDIFEEIGVSVKRNWDKRIIEVRARKIDTHKLAQCEQLRKIRASILMLGPILAREKKCEIFSPGGCVIGVRSHEIHTDGFEVLGATLLQDGEKISLKIDPNVTGRNRILLSEASVTGTENLAMFLAGQENRKAEIYFSASEPHVCATLQMLKKMGASIEGIGTHHLTIVGTKYLRGGDFKIPPDGILVGTYAIAGVLTNSEIEIENVDHRELFSFYGCLRRIGGEFEMKKNVLRILPHGKLKAISKIQTAIYPGFSTDLQSPFGVLLTQCEGDSVLFETLFENRLSYLHELEKMGADIHILNAHQARISGPTVFRGAEVQSWDLRAGAAVVLAGLIAEGKTKVTNIQYIDRGYENFVENLQFLGAKIKRVKQ